ncbi:MAG: tetratricopeptide repeat protein [bacterium]|nr:tetratricopeptide repeat protein [bacterium]
MKRGVLLIVLAAVSVTIGVGFVALGDRPQWTSASPAALVEFEAAMDALDMLYMEEAVARLEAALELDPEFVIAKLELANQIRHYEPERADSLYATVFDADLDGLTPREQFLVERIRLIANDKRDEADLLIDAYLQEYPDDHFVLRLKASRAFGQQRLDEAEADYLELLHKSPNFVLAYNQLGYINMQRGNFAKAEEYLTSYRFIAPDQANPYDSLAELFILQGRYEEADASLREAVRLRPDFWAAYEHLLLSALSREDFAAAETASEDARSSGCPDDMVQAFGCWTEMERLREDQKWHELLAIPESECGTGYSKTAALAGAHFAACKLDDFGRAQEIQSIVAEGESGDEELEEMKGIMRALMSSLEGTRLAFERDYEGAFESLREADGELVFQNAGVGTFKLSNQLAMIEVLRAMDRLAEASELLVEVRMVNPTLVERFEEDGYQVMGLE